MSHNTRSNSCNFHRVSHLIERHFFFIWLLLQLQGHSGNTLPCPDAWVGTKEVLTDVRLVTHHIGNRSQSTTHGRLWQVVRISYLDRFWVQISVITTVVLAVIFRDFFFRYIQTNTGPALRLGHGCFLLLRFKFIRQSSYNRRCMDHGDTQ